jgi:hypothetical protein
MPSKYEYLKQINEIHNLAVRRLLEGEHRMLPELAELCEDIGNLYLDISDVIRKDIMIQYASESDPEGHED